MVSLAGLLAAVVVAANAAMGGTASVFLNVAGLVMLAVFVVAMVMVFVVTARLRQQAPEVHGAARAVHRGTHHPVLVHPHDRRRHPVGYVFWLVLLTGWMMGAVVVFPRLVDSAAYLAGAGGSATFVPRSYVLQCGGRRLGCSAMATDGVLEANGHSSPVTWPSQVPLNVPFTVRKPVWRWALGSGLMSGDVTAIGSFFVGLLFDGGAVLAAFLIVRPGLERLRHRRGPPAAATAPVVRHQPKRHRRHH